MGSATVTLERFDPAMLNNVEVRRCTFRTLEAVWPTHLFDSGFALRFCPVFGLEIVQAQAALELNPIHLHGRLL